MSRSESERGAGRAPGDPTSGTQGEEEEDNGKEMKLALKEK